MSRNTLSIKPVLLFFVVLITLILALSVSMFSNKFTLLKNDLAYVELQHTVTQYAEKLDQEVESAKESVLRLKGYVTILNRNLTTDSRISEDNLALFQQMMVDNLQFENNQYNNYFALESVKARQDFGNNGQLLIAHKNIAQRDTVNYNKPQNMLMESWTEPTYANDPRKFWYHLSKRTQDIQVTPMYYDEEYTKMWLFSVSQGLYQHRTFQGVVGVSILVDGFLEGIEKKKLGETGGLFLVDYQTGTVLSKIGKPGSSQLNFLNMTERMAANLYSAELKQPFWKETLTNNINYQEVNNGNQVVYTLSSKKLRNMPWTLVGYQRSSELLKDESSIISVFTGFIIVIFVIFLIMMGILFKMLIFPLSRLIKKAKHTGQPGEETTIPITGFVELRQLGEALKLLITKLNKTTAEKTECIKRLQNAHATQSTQTQQLAQREAELAKVNIEAQNSRAEAQKARLQIQKARVEIQKYKLEAQRAKLQTQAANQAKAQFLANMNHELRTPMNAVIGYTEILQEDARDRGQEEFIPDLQKIHGASYHLLDLINNLFDMSRIESSKMDLYIETFDIAPMIQDITMTIMPLLEKQSNILRVDCDSALGTMTADLTKVRQNLMNLLSNANKFSKQSTINLSVSRESVDEMDWVVFRVIDHGIGMTPDQMQKLFQAFTQLDDSPTRKYGGSGLGLAITKQFCQIMGGDISVESQFGQGSTFTMRLPAQVNLA